MSPSIIFGMLLVLIALSSLCSGLETAITALSPFRVRRMSEKGHKNAKRLHLLIQRKESVVGSLLLLNTASNIAATSLATFLFLQFFGETGILIATMMMTLTVFIVAELAPKTIALHMAESLTLFFSFPLYWISRVYALVTYPITFVIRKITTHFKSRQNQIVKDLTALDEVSGMINHLRTTEKQYESTFDMIEGVLDLESVTVESVMVYRSNIIALNRDKPEQWQKNVVKTRYRRLPVWQKNTDNIIGELDVWGFLEELAQRGTQDVESIGKKHLSEPFFVPETTTLKQQMEDFLHRKIHQALVIDEYGILQGLVCLEDILEEIVGPINEEARERGKQEHEGMKPMADGTWQVEGWVTVRDYNRATESNLPEESASTMAGLMLNEFKRVPDLADSLQKYGSHFSILKSNERSIEILSINKNINHQHND